MVVRCAEAWSNGKLVAVKNSDGGYSYFLSTEGTVNGIPIASVPNVCLEMTALNLEIINAKENGK